MAREGPRPEERARVLRLDVGEQALQKGDRPCGLSTRKIVTPWLIHKAR